MLPCENEDIGTVYRMYRENLDMIVEECDGDMIAFERVKYADIVCRTACQHAKNNETVAADCGAGAAIRVGAERLDDIQKHSLLSAF